MISALLQSAMLIADACESFSDYCVIGIEPNLERIDENLRNSLMLMTALNPNIGYENVAKIAKSLCRAYQFKKGQFEIGIAD